MARSQDRPSRGVSRGSGRWSNGYDAEIVRSGSRGPPNYVGGRPLLRDGAKVEYESSVASASNEDQTRQVLV